MGKDLKCIYGVQRAPSNTQMRERLDQLGPRQLRGSFQRLLAQYQRSGRLALYRHEEEPSLIHQSSI